MLGIWTDRSGVAEQRQPIMVKGHIAEPCLSQGSPPNMMAARIPEGSETSTSYNNINLNQVPFHKT